MKVLLVAYRFPPQRGVGALRPAKLVKTWIGCGRIEVAVLGGPPEADGEGDPSLMEGIPADLVHLAVDDPSLWLKSGEMARRLPDSGMARIARRLLLGLRYLSARFAVPDPQSGWIPGAVRAGIRLARSFQPDVIVATGPPYSTFVVAAILARYAHVPFVVDYRDPWSLSRRSLRDSLVARIVHPAVERRLLSRAGGIVAAHRAILDNIRRRMPDRGRDRLMLWAPNGFDPDDFGAAPAPDKRFTLSYVGSLVKPRDPRPLLRAVEDLVNQGRLDPASIQLRFIGALGSFPRAPEVDRLSSIVEVGGRVPHREAVRIMQASTANLVIQADLGGAGGDTTPAKLYEALYAARPLLLLSPEGRNTRLARRAGGVWIAPATDQQAIRSRLEEMLDLWRGGSLPSPDPAMIRLYSRPRQALRFASFLETVVASSGSCSGRPPSGRAS